MEGCKHYCEGYYSDDIGYEETDKINACGLTQTGYHEMSYKKCSDITNCYYKQLLAEQAKNKLEAERNKSFENVRQLLYAEIKKLSRPDMNFNGIDEMVQQNIDLQAKNKKLVEALEEISGCTQHKSDFCNHQSDCSFCRMRQAQQALNEVNK